MADVTITLRPQIVEATLTGGTLTVVVQTGTSEAAGVSSFNGRTGAVTPATGDYTAAQITETAERVFVSPAEKTAIGTALQEDHVITHPAPTTRDARNEAAGVAASTMTAHTDAHPVPTNRDTRNQIAGSYEVGGAVDAHELSHPVPTNRDTRNEAADAAIQAHIGGTGSPHTAAGVGADATGTASGLMSTHETTHPIPTTRDDRNEAAGVAASTMTTHETTHPAPTNRDTRNEAAAGNPAADGDVLSSTIAGVRSWVARLSKAAADLLYDAIGTAAGLISSHESAHPAPTNRDTRNEAAGVAASTMTTHETTHPAPTTRDSRNEADLGNPDTDGKVLSSTAAGVRSWIDPAAGASYTDADARAAQVLPVLALGNLYTVADGGNVASATDTTLTKTSAGWTVDEHDGAFAVITGGTGEGQAREIASNTADTLTVTEAWTTNPDATSTFDIRSGKSQAIDWTGEQQVQTATIGGAPFTFTKGTGWAASGLAEMRLHLTVTAIGAGTWTIATNWINPPASLAIGTHIIQLSSLDGTITAIYGGITEAMA